MHSYLQENYTISLPFNTGDQEAYTQTPQVWGISQMCHQTLSSRVGSGVETMDKEATGSEAPLVRILNFLIMV